MQTSGLWESSPRAGGRAGELLPTLGAAGGRLGGGERTGEQKEGQAACPQAQDARANGVRWRDRGD